MNIYKREDIADLLYRYPRVSDAEAKRIVTFLRKGRRGSRRSHGRDRGLPRLVLAHLGADQAGDTDGLT
jgi:hypothetical protein